MLKTDIPTILVPHGVEHAAVQRGLRHSIGAAPEHLPDVVPIPIGQAAIRQFLQSWQPASRVLVMGLCGGLQPRYTVGSAVLYHQCVHSDQARYWCDRDLSDRLYQQLSANAVQLTRVTGLTSDRPLCSTVEKRSLGHWHQADVVDMEGVAILEALQPYGAAVAMLRVVSDDCRHAIPDLSAAITPAGTLRQLPLALSMIRQPVASLRLIRGSLHGLQQMQTIAAALFAQP